MNHSPASISKNSRLLIARKALAEGLGTALLIVAVVGSGIMATNLSPNDVGLQLLENAIATGGALVALILTCGSISGAHFNPAVTLSFRAQGELSNTETLAFISAQIIGACVGSVIANVMFSLDPINLSTKSRSTGPFGSQKASPLWACCWSFTA